MQDQRSRNEGATRAPGGGDRVAVSRGALRSLRGLLAAQFLGAFNDNALKLFLALLAIRALNGAAADGGSLEAASQAATTRIFVVFTAPLMLVSVFAAWFADRVSKRSMLVAMKAVEVVLMALGAVALWIDPGGGWPSLVVLAAMGAQSAMFGPAKYGILPESLPAERLVAGNGIMEAATFAAIVLGTAAGGAMLDAVGARTWLAGAALTVLAVIGLLAIRHTPAVPPAGARESLGRTVGQAIRAIGAKRELWLAVAGSVFFWLVGSLLTQDALIYSKSVLGLSDARAGIPLAVVVVGIGLGAGVVGGLSRRGIEVGWIPIGTLGLAAACVALGLLSPGFTGTLACLGVAGVAGGLVIVPLNAVIQHEAPRERCGAVIAISNALIFGGVLAGTLGCGALATAGLSSPAIFVAAGIATLAGTAWALWLLPAALARLVLMLATHTVYRIRVVDADRVPAEGPVLLVCNHVSLVDGLLLMASLRRPVRFVVDRSWFERWWMRPFMRLFGFVPIAQDASPREMIESVRRASEHLDRGEVLCVFAEGQVSRTGQLLPFKRGFQRIVKGRDVPIVPVHLDRLWGSRFSFAGVRRGRRLPLRIPYRVTLSFGRSLPGDAPVASVRDAVRSLECDAWQLRAEDALPLPHRFWQWLRRAPWRAAVADAGGPAISRLVLGAAAICLARALRRPWGGQRRIGVLLPPSVGGAIANTAAALAGRSVVNLNYTVGPDALASAVDQAELRTVVTTRECLKRLRVELPAGIEPVFFDEVMRGVTGWRRFAAAVAALLLPMGVLQRLCGARRRSRPGDPLTVIFSSGSTGDPKGVELTHWNLAANADAASQALPVSEADCVVGILPLFHSFGTLALWFALGHGMRIVFHPNPLDPGAVGALVERHRATVLVATPTFLQLYLRRVEPGQFGALRLVIAGAEKLPVRLADAFENRFGIRPLEGYGATECSPVIAVNAPSFRQAGFYQSGSRPGTVGQPLPGVAVRVVDLETGRDLPPGSPGMLLVRGPNVMAGYLGRPDLTAEVLEDGWYRTGDVATVDDDGFVTISDRLSRFSKIGGEMVPHGVVEAALQEAAEATEQVFAVTGIEDARKGERLAVLHTLEPDRVESILRAVSAAGLPKLFLPRAEDFVRVAALPLLGTGKLDLRAVRRTARDALVGREVH